jgi:hypothetical protein
MQQALLMPWAGAKAACGSAMRSGCPTRVGRSQHGRYDAWLLQLLAGHAADGGFLPGSRWYSAACRAG